MYLTLVFGIRVALGIANEVMASWSIITWVIILLGYSYVASVLPVWTLLQPRDYINSLTVDHGARIGRGWSDHGRADRWSTSVISGGERIPLEISAPMIRANPAGAPAVIPFLFITIACGACSGFHCLVSSGTSSKQIKCETDAQFVGYGSMLTEGFLATIVILACVSGLGLGAKVAATGEMVTGEAAYLARYETWASASGLGAKVGAFVDGSANFLTAMSVPSAIAVAIMGVLVASFAGTTLDTACRLQRYVIQELASTFVGQRTSEMSSSGISVNPLVWLTNKHGATIFAVILALIIAALPGYPIRRSHSQMLSPGIFLRTTFKAMRTCPRPRLPAELAARAGG